MFVGISYFLVYWSLMLGLVGLFLVEICCVCMYMFIVMDYLLFLWFIEFMKVKRKYFYWKYIYCRFKSFGLVIVIFL